MLKEDRELDDVNEHKNLIKKSERFKQHFKIFAIERSTKTKFE